MCFLLVMFQFPFICALQFSLGVWHSQELVVQIQFTLNLHSCTFIMYYCGSVMYYCRSVMYYCGSVMYYCRSVMYYCRSVMYYCT